MEKSIARQVYEGIADQYAAIAEDRPINAHCDRPTMLSLMPAVQGKIVVDAGCGPGIYTKWLAKQGAKVLALDYSPRLVELARERVGDSKVSFRVADLADGLGFMEDGECDLFLSVLVLDYVLDWPALFKEVYRVLSQKGHFLSSFRHPCFRGEGVGTPSYPEIQQVYTSWEDGFGRKVRMPSFRRSLTSAFEAITGAGFLIDRVVEAFPDTALQSKDPELYDLVLGKPPFLCIRAIKQ